QLTGVLRSPEFTIPASLRFFCAGHNGQPPEKHAIKNTIRLRLVEKDQTIAEAAPPRNDMAQPITWDLAKYAGKRGYIEVIDGDNGDAYAWLAVGRFEPAVIKAPAAISARINTMRSVPQRLQLALAKSLAATPAGAEALLQAIGEGKASPRILGDATVKERLVVSKPADLEERLKRLMKGQPEVD